jgi:hypothetical protein
MEIEKHARNEEEKNYLKENISLEFYPKLDFDFRNPEDKDGEKEALKEINQEYTPLENVDYLCRDHKTPLSYTKIKTVDDGIEWYKYYHSYYSDELIEIIARKTWGTLPKKNEKRKYNKKRVKKEGLKVVRRETTLSWD